jgi:hypothetical protein
VRCPGCGRATSDGPAYLLLCPDCSAARVEPPLRSLPQAHAAGDDACGGLCGGTELVWYDTPAAAAPTAPAAPPATPPARGGGLPGTSEQSLVPCPDCAPRSQDR